MLAAVLAIAPVAGIPPKSAEPTLPIPCATSSAFELCFEFIIPSATTHESKDSIAARTAIVNASGKTFFANPKFIEGKSKGGRFPSTS